MDHKPSFQEGTYVAFFDDASARKHKHFKREGSCRIYKTETGSPRASLRDSYGNVIVDEYWGRDNWHKLFDVDGFTIDKWDVRCEEPANEAISQPSSLKMMNQFKPASSLFTPYKMPTFVTTAKSVNEARVHRPRRLFTSSSSQPLDEPLLSRQDVSKMNPLESDDGYFVTFSERKRMMKDMELHELEYPKQCEKCYAVVTSDIHDCPNSTDEQDSDNDSKKQNLYWSKCAVEKAVIPKSRLLEVVEEYPTEYGYVGGVFDGFILAGHFLDGILDTQFDKIRLFMRQL